MRVRPIAVLVSVVSASALAAWFVASQLPREGDVSPLPPGPVAAAPAETSPALEPPAAAVAGSVEVRVTAGPEPLGGASVRLYAAADGAPGRWRRAGEATTDRAGVAVLAARPGPYLAVARAPGLAPGRAEVFLPADARRERAEIVLEPPATLEGRVRTPAGEPVAGARALAVPIVSAWPGFDAPAAPPEETAVAETDATGTFRLPGLTPGVHSLSLDAPGRRPVLVPRVGVPGVPLAVTLEPLGDAPEKTPREAAATIEGAVSRPDGAPAARAGIAILAHDRREVVARAVAGPNGGFSLGGLAPGSYDLEAFAPGTSPARLRGVTLAPGARFEAHVALAGTGVVRGTVRDGAGRPLAGVRVRALPSEEGLAVQGPRETRTDFEGRFRLAGVELGRAEVAARQDGVLSGAARAVQVQEGSETSLELVLPEAGVLSGRVVAGERPPPAGTTVLALPMQRGSGTLQVARAAADATGNFAMPLPAGEYRVLAGPGADVRADERAAPAFVRVEPGRTTQLRVELAAVLDRPLEILVLEPGGAPSPGATVTLSRPADGKIALAARARDDGRVELDARMGMSGLPVNVQARNGGRRGEVTLALPESGTVVVRLAPGGAVEGIVRGARRGFTLEVSSQPGAGGWRPVDVHTFAGERFALADLPAEPIRLVARTPDGRRASTELRVMPGETRSVELALR
jgi:hypothetical protein